MVVLGIARLPTYWGLSMGQRIYGTANLLSVTNLATQISIETLPKMFCSINLTVKQAIHSIILQILFILYYFGRNLSSAVYVRCFIIDKSTNK